MRRFSALSGWSVRTTALFTSFQVTMIWSSNRFESLFETQPLGTLLQAGAYLLRGWGRRNVADFMGCRGCRCLMITTVSEAGGLPGRGRVRSVEVAGD